MKRVLLIILTWVIVINLLFSQESDAENSFTPVNQSTLIGIGKASIYDSYLSPLYYDGTAISLLHDRIKRSDYFNKKLLLQNRFRIQTGITENPSSTASEYWGSIYYSLNGFYPISDSNNLRLYGGGGIQASLGGIYNVRNSNNPGSLKSDFNLNMGVMALYNWKRFTFRWQVTSPFAGIFFSPGYGHSYYEIFTLGNNKGTLHFGSFHNQLAFRNYFTVDIPANNITFRVGYLWDYYNTDVNQLATIINSHQLVLGLAFESLSFGGKKGRKKSEFNSIYYNY